MVSDWQGGDISKLFPALSGKEDLSMGEDKKADCDTEIHPHGLCEKAGMAHSKNVCGRWLFWYKFPKTKFPEYDKRH